MTSVKEKLEKALREIGLAGEVYTWEKPQPTVSVQLKTRPEFGRQEFYGASLPCAGFKAMTWLADLRMA